MSRKNKIIISVTGIILVLVTLIGLTYAYYLTRINGNTNDKSVTVSLANLELTYSDGNGLIEANNIVPGEVIATKTFSVENTGDKKVINYTVYLDDVINTFENKNDVKLTLTCTSSKGNKCTGTEITYPSTDTLLSINDIEVEEKHNYELKVEFIETNTDQSIDMNKELSGNIIIRDLKGTGSEITNTKGTNSVSVENAKLLSNYRIYGNSVQETRSGKNIVKELRSGKNTVLTNGIITTGSENKDTYFNLVNGDFANLSGKEVTLSFDAEVSSDTAWKFAVNQSSPSVSFYVKNGHNTVTFTIGNANDRLTIDDNSRDVTIKCTMKNLQLELGSTATEYEAYGATPSIEYPSEIKSVGDLVTDTNDANNGKYKIGVKTIEKNVFDIDTAISYNANGLVVSKNEDGSLNLKGTLTSKFAYYGPMQKQYIKSGTTLITKGYFEGTTDETYIGIVLYNKNKEIIKQFNSLKNSQTGSIKLTDDVYYIGAVWRLPNSNVGDYYEINNIKIQLEEGSVATDYESYHEETTNIYLDEPLRKIDNYTDYIDFKSGKVVRNIYAGILDGTITWNLGGTTSNDYQTFYTHKYSEKALNENRNCLSDKFKNIVDVTLWNAPNPYLIQTGSSDRVCYVTLPKSVASDISQAKQFFNENNSKYYFILNTQTEETVSLPNVDLNKVKYINIESSTNPSSIELDYVK